MVGNVVREPLLSAYVGYWCDSAGDQQRGDDGGASRSPSTTASGRSGCTAWRRPCGRRTAPSLRVLAKLGFREEGLFRRYLDVDGAWRDHLCFAFTAEDLPIGRRRGPVSSPRVAPSGPEFRHSGLVLPHAAHGGEPRRVGASFPGRDARRSLPLSVGCDLVRGDRGRVRLRRGEEAAVPSSMIFASLVVLWLLILVPAVARHRQEVARPSVAALSGRVLARSPRRRSQEVSGMASEDEDGRGRWLGWTTATRTAEVRVPSARTELRFDDAEPTEESADGVGDDAVDDVADDAGEDWADDRVRRRAGSGPRPVPRRVAAGSTPRPPR